MPKPTPKSGSEGIDSTLLAYKLANAALKDARELLATPMVKADTYYELLKLSKVLNDGNIEISLNDLWVKALEIHKLLQKKNEQLTILQSKLKSLEESYHEARHLPGRTYGSWLRFRLDNLLFLERCLPIFYTHADARIAKCTRLLREQNASLIEQQEIAMQTLRTEKRRVKNFQEMYAIELNQTKSQILALFERHQSLCREQLHELRQAASKHHSLARVKTSMSTEKVQESLLQRLSNKVQSFLHTLFNTNRIEYAKQRS